MQATEREVKGVNFKLHDMHYSQKLQPQPRPLKPSGTLLSPSSSCLITQAEMKAESAY